MCIPHKVVVQEVLLAGMYETFSLAHPTYIAVPDVGSEKCQKLKYHGNKGKRC
jgi:hypothetical protein